MEFSNLFNVTVRARFYPVRERYHVFFVNICDFFFSLGTTLRGGMM